MLMVALFLAWVEGTYNGGLSAKFGAAPAESRLELHQMSLCACLERAYIVGRNRAITPPRPYLTGIVLPR
jgi:hypothetical protein